MLGGFYVMLNFFMFISFDFSKKNLGYNHSFLISIPYQTLNAQTTALHRGGVNYDFITVLGGAILKSVSFAPPEKISHHATVCHLVHVSKLIIP